MRYLFLLLCLLLTACSNEPTPKVESEPIATSKNVPLKLIDYKADDSNDLVESLNRVSDKGDANASDSDYYSYDDPRDPLEPFNRTMWDFNYELLDPYLFKPISHTYNDYLYDGVKEGSNNMVQNLREPSTAVNHLLQLNIEDSLAAIMRFLLNSSLGLAGYYDLAAQVGLERKREDFSNILGKVGFSEGPYVMLPVLGPKTVREYVGDTVDKLYFPFSSFTLLQDFVRWGVDGLYKRHQVIDQEELLDSSVDPYLFVKDAYLQHRLYQFYDGNIPEALQDNSFEEIPDEFLDELD